ncbi:MAG TPA: hypothetical protein VK926_05375 [Gaiellaceae bacterium]|nr:hypothetical protein [Gaiellaceae bacterium]
MSGGGYAALAYGVVLVVVVAYVAIIAAKLQRLQREAGELAELARRASGGEGRGPSVTHAAPVAAASTPEEDAR